MANIGKFVSASDLNGGKCSCKCSLNKDNVTKGFSFDETNCS